MTLVATLRQLAHPAPARSMAYVGEAVRSETRSSLV